MFVICHNRALASTKICQRLYIFFSAMLSKHDQQSMREQMPHDRMTLTDFARHVGISRPTAYKLVRTVSFPTAGTDKRWDRKAVLDWLAENTVSVEAVLVAGVLVRSEAAE
jgi:predicted DNA-binding transcriptional regulator AlpA